MDHPLQVGFDGLDLEAMDGLGLDRTLDLALDGRDGGGSPGVGPLPRESLTGHGIGGDFRCFSGRTDSIFERACLPLLHDVRNLMCEQRGRGGRFERRRAVAPVDVSARDEGLGVQGVRAHSCGAVVAYPDSAQVHAEGLFHAGLHRGRQSLGAGGDISRSHALQRLIPKRMRQSERAVGLRAIPRSSLRRLILLLREGGHA